MTTAAPIIRRRSVYADKLLEYADFVFSDGAEFGRCGAWREFFNRRIGNAFDGRVIFEIGCNDATLLARVAARHPTAFIGIDWKCRALHTAAGRVAEADLRNIAFLHGRAQDVYRFFADDELDEVWLFLPDPCDKPNELRNRLYAEPFLRDVHGVMRPGADLILKTDHPDYYASSLTVVASMVKAFDLAASSADFWNDHAAQKHAAAKCFFGESSSFETRYLKKRRPIHYLAITKR